MMFRVFYCFFYSFCISNTYSERMMMRRRLNILEMSEKSPYFGRVLTETKMEHIQPQPSQNTKFTELELEEEQEKYLNDILDEKTHIIKASGKENTKIGYFAALQMLESNKIDKLVIIGSKEWCNKSRMCSVEREVVLSCVGGRGIVGSSKLVEKIILTDMLSVLWLSKPRCMIVIEYASSMWHDMWIKDKRLLSYKKVLITNTQNEIEELRWNISKREIIRPSLSTFGKG